MKAKLDKKVRKMKTQVMSFSNDGLQVKLDVPDSTDVKETFGSVINTVVEQEEEIGNLRSNIKKLKEDHAVETKQLISWTTDNLNKLQQQNNFLQSALLQARSQISNLSHNLQGFVAEEDEESFPIALFNVTSKIKEIKPSELTLFQTEDGAFPNPDLPERDEKGVIRRRTSSAVVDPQLYGSDSDDDDNSEKYQNKGRPAPLESPGGSSIASAPSRLSKRDESKSALLNDNDLLDENSVGGVEEAIRNKYSVPIANSSEAQIVDNNTNNSQQVMEQNEDINPSRNSKNIEDVAKESIPTSEEKQDASDVTAPQIVPKTADGSAVQSRSASIAEGDVMDNAIPDESPAITSKEEVAFSPSSSSKEDLVMENAAPPSRRGSDVGSITSGSVNRVGNDTSGNANPIANDVSRKGSVGSMDQDNKSVAGGSMKNNNSIDEPPKIPTAFPTTLGRKKNPEEKVQSRLFYLSVKNNSLPHRAIERWRWAIRKVMQIQRLKAAKVSVTRTRLGKGSSVAERMDRIDLALFHIPEDYKKLVELTSVLLKQHMEDKMIAMDEKMNEVQSALKTQLEESDMKVEDLRRDMVRVGMAVRDVSNKMKEQNENQNEAILKNINQIESHVSDVVQLDFDRLSVGLSDIESKLNDVGIKAENLIIKLQMDKASATPRNIDKPDPVPIISTDYEIAHENGMNENEILEGIVNSTSPVNEVKQPSPLSEVLKHDTELRAARTEIGSIEGSVNVIEGIFNGLKKNIESMKMLRIRQTQEQNENPLITADQVADVKDLLERCSTIEVLINGHLSKIDKMKSTCADYDKLVANKWDEINGISHALASIGSITKDMNVLGDDIQEIKTTVKKQEEIVEKSSAEQLEIIDEMDKEVGLFKSKLKKLDLGLKELKRTAGVNGGGSVGSAEELEYMLEPMVKRLVQSMIKLKLPPSKTSSRDDSPSANNAINVTGEDGLAKSPGSKRMIRREKSSVSDDLDDEEDNGDYDDKGASRASRAVPQTRNKRRASVSAGGTDLNDDEDVEKVEYEQHLAGRSKSPVAIAKARLNKQRKLAQLQGLDAIDAVDPNGVPVTTPMTNSRSHSSRIMDDDSDEEIAIAVPRSRSSNNRITPQINDSFDGNTVILSDAEDGSITQPVNIQHSGSSEVNRKTVISKSTSKSPSSKNSIIHSASKREINVNDRDDFDDGNNNDDMRSSHNQQPPGSSSRRSILKKSSSNINDEFSEQNYRSDKPSREDRDQFNSDLPVMSNNVMDDLTEIGVTDAPIMDYHQHHNDDIGNDNKNSNEDMDRVREQMQRLAKKLDEMNKTKLGLGQAEKMIKQLMSKGGHSVGTYDSDNNSHNSSVDELNRTVRDLVKELLVMKVSHAKEIADLRNHIEIGLSHSLQKMQNEIEDANKFSIANTKALCLSCGRDSVVRPITTSGVQSNGFIPTLSSSTIPGPDVLRAGFKMPVRVISPNYKYDPNRYKKSVILEDMNIDKISYDHLPSPNNIIDNNNSLEQPSTASTEMDQADGMRVGFRENESMIDHLQLPAILDSKRLTSSKPVRNVRHAQGNLDAQQNLRPIYRKGFPAKKSLRAETAYAPERFDININPKSITN
eukprot:gene9421-12694_t